VTVLTFYKLQELSPQSSAHTTPSHAPTPNSSQAAASARESGIPTPVSSTSVKGPSIKKKKVIEKEEEDNDAKPPKRLKLNMSRGEKGGPD
jgi:chromatin modification-related protein EAF6